jgi:hypothetical protein
VDHGRGQIIVPEQVLNGADVGAALAQVRSEGMANGVGTDGLRQTGTADGHLDGCVDDAGGNVMATGDARTQVYGQMTAATASRVMTTGTLICLSVRTAWMRPSMAWWRTRLSRNPEALMAWFWVAGATFPCTARSVRNASIFGSGERGPRATACRGNGRTGRSAPQRRARCAWSRSGDGAPVGRHRGVWVVDFSARQAYKVPVMAP